MKKAYEAPSMEITKFTTEDVLEGSIIEGTGTIRPDMPDNPLPNRID